MGRTIATVLAVVFGFASSAHAAFFNNGSGLTGTYQTITFDEFPLANFEPVINQYGFLGVSFSGAHAAVGNMPDPNQTGVRITNYASPASNDPPPVIIRFANEVTQADIALLTLDGPTTFQARLRGVLVESATARTFFLNPINFYGFRGIAFDELMISRNIGPASNGMTLDNLQFTSAVPEPQAWLLMLAGWGALAVRRRRSAITLTR